MPRYIDADELKEWIENWLYKDRYYHNGRVSKTIPITELYDLLEQIPTADVHEVRHGKWQMKPLFNSHFDESDVTVMIRCSGCGMKLIAQKCGLFPNYCPNCGADMRERREDAEIH